MEKIIFEPIVYTIDTDFNNMFNRKRIPLAMAMDSNFNSFVKYAEIELKYRKDSSYLAIKHVIEVTTFKGVYEVKNRFWGSVDMSDSDNYKGLSDKFVCLYLKYKGMLDNKFVSDTVIADNERFNAIIDTNIK